jgi:hypothetical protein
MFYMRTYLKIEEKKRQGETLKIATPSMLPPT